MLICHPSEELMPAVPVHVSAPVPAHGTDMCRHLFAWWSLACRRTSELPELLLVLNGWTERLCVELLPSTYPYSYHRETSAIRPLSREGQLRCWEKACEAERLGRGCSVALYLWTFLFLCKDQNHVSSQISIGGKVAKKPKLDQKKKKNTTDPTQHP